MTAKAPDKMKNQEKDRCKGFTILQQAAWRVAFLRDIAAGGAISTDNGGPGLSTDGEAGLGAILEDVEKDINRAMEII